MLKIRPLPKLGLKTGINYQVNEFANAHIFETDCAGKPVLIYEIKEIELKRNEKLLLEEIKSALIDVLNLDMGRGSAEGKQYIEKALRYVLSEYGIKIDEQVYNKLNYYCYAQLIGYNEIQPLFDDLFVKGIVYSKGLVFVNHSKYGLIRANIKLSQNTLKRIKERAGLKASDFEIEERKEEMIIRTKDRTALLPINMKISVEIAAYLWHKIENGTCIGFAAGNLAGRKEALDMLFSLSYFVPSKKRIALINCFSARENTIIYMDEKARHEEDMQKQIVEDILLEKPDYVFADFYGMEFSKIKGIAYISEQGKGMRAGVACFFDKGLIKLDENKRNVFERTRRGYKLNTKGFAIEELRAITKKGKWLNIIKGKSISKHAFLKAIETYYKE
ncbi:hypothetical protein HZB88_04860 [archaeon]|nr:hypothetical protein [archaeon]